MIGAWLASAALACGPFEAVCLLSEPPEILLSAPVGGWAEEIAALGEPAPHRYVEGTPPLGGSGAARAAYDRGAAAFHRLHGTWEEPANPWVEGWLDRRGDRANGDRAALPEIEGAMRAVLALPEAEREPLEAAAWFTLGRAWFLVGRWEEAGAAFRQVRERVAAGAPDPQGLALASYGEEAAIALGELRYADALRLYRIQQGGGDPSAPASARVVVRAVLRDPDADLAALARDPALARAVTAWLLGSAAPTDPAQQGTHRRWLAALEAAGATDAVGADRLAWAYYALGDWEMARRWLAHAPDTAAAHWIRGKLHLRAGDLDAAEAELARVPPALRADANWGAGWWDRDPLAYGDLSPRREALAELGTVRVAQGRYVDALAAFVEGDRWDEAADVADRLLTVDELKGWVDANVPSAPPPPPDELPNAYWDTRQVPVSLRWLVGRRLARADRAAEAVPYFPPSLQDEATALRDARAALADARGPDARAYALFHLATIERRHGLELLGTEHAPDVVSTRGDMPTPDVTGRRLAGPAGAGLGPDELARRAASAPSPYVRWHYRRVAAEHAWEAAALLPDDDDRTIRTLCRAGSWLAGKDPEAADRFYKAMVTRGWNHPLAREADHNRWFPADCGEPWPAGPPASRWSCATAPWPAPAAWWILAAWALRRRRGA